LISYNKYLLRVIEFILLFEFVNQGETEILVLFSSLTQSSGAYSL